MWLVGGWVSVRGEHSGRKLERGLELIAERLHVEIDRSVEPFLVLPRGPEPAEGLAGQGADEPQAARFIGEDAHDMGAALEFLV